MDCASAPSAGPSDSRGAAGQGRLSHSAGTGKDEGPKLPKLFPPPHILVLNYQSEHNAFAKESDLLKSMCMIFK